MKKSVLTRILAASLCGAMLAGCGSTASNSSSSTAGSTAAADAAATTAATAAAEASTTADEAATTAGTTAAASDVTLEIETNVGGDELDNFRKLVDGFTDQTGIGVDLVTPGTDYEPVMKTRMASGDMPDVFVTHGWSILRYKPFLLDVTDQDFSKDYEDAILPVISDDDGRIFVNCVSNRQNGIVYNKTVLDKAGVDPSKILTTDDLLDACQKIKDSGVTPFYLGAKDGWPTGALVEDFGPAFYTVDGCKDPAKDKLLDGTFDWTTDGKDMFEFIGTMIQKGYFNEDVLTADSDTEYQEIANDQCAFSLNGNIADIHTYNADAQLGIIPIPNSKDGGKLYFPTGENNAFGVWKDSEYTDEGVQFLSYLNQPEVAASIVKADGSLPAHKNTPIDSSNETYAEIENCVNTYGDQLFYDNIFDREYLPNGMWSVITDSLAMMYADPTDSGTQQAEQNMQDNFVEKYEAAQTE